MTKKLTLRVEVMARIAQAVEDSIYEAGLSLGPISDAEIDYGILIANQRISLRRLVNRPEGRKILDSMVVKEQK